MELVTIVVIVKMFVWVIMHASFTQATDISKIKFKEDNTSKDTNTGVLLLKYDGIWYSICYSNDWGRRESLVACRQLGFNGGWPYPQNTTDSSALQPHLTEWDCDGSEIDIGDCRSVIGDEGEECQDERVAGIRCYSSYEVRLIGGMAPNAGRVEVRYDDVWMNVCYQPTQGKSKQWSFYNVEIVCKELGFPGAMLRKQGGQGNGIRRGIIAGYQCKSDLREDNLKDCFPDSPIMLSPGGTGPSCGEQNGQEGNEAVAICAVPGYIGCFTAQGTTTLSAIQSTNMTINICRNYCRRNTFTHAYLHQGDRCACGGDMTEPPVRDTECQKECLGNSDQTCGGDDYLSVYSVTEGLCDDPLNGSAIYYYGDFFKCGPGMEPAGTTSIQCIMGKSSEMEWNDDTVPECKEQTKEKDEDGGEPKAGAPDILGIAVGVPFGCVVLLLVALLGFYFYKRRAQRAEQHNRNMSNNTACATPSSSANTSCGSSLIKGSTLASNIADYEGVGNWPTASAECMHYEEIREQTPHYAEIRETGVPSAAPENTETPISINMATGNDDASEKSFFDRFISISGIGDVFPFGKKKLVENPIYESGDDQAHSQGRSEGRLPSPK